MGEFTQDDQSNGVASIPMSLGGKKSKSKAKLGGPMHLEEIRMNKNLLKEISKIKKMQGGKTERPKDNDDSIYMENNRNSGLNDIIGHNSLH